jgi:hypothetical protein
MDYNISKTQQFSNQNKMEVVEQLISEYNLSVVVYCHVLRLVMQITGVNHGQAWLIPKIGDPISHQCVISSN